MPGSKDTPPGALYYIKHKDHALFPPVDRCGGSRFDDSHDPFGYRVLYTGDRRAVFLETLLPFRSSGWNKIKVRDFPKDWLENYKLSELRWGDRGEPERWLDFTCAETFADFDIIFANELQERGIDCFVLSVATRIDTELTQAVSRWAFENDYSGIYYVTRRAADHRCWAAFEGRCAIAVSRSADDISANDPDFVAVMDAYRVRPT